MSTFRPIAFVLLASNHGTLIVNRNDYYDNRETGAHFGIGFELFHNSSYEPADMYLKLELLKLRRHAFGDGVFAIDCGANIGIHTIEYAKLMHDWGSVIGFEAQEQIYYALAGNVAINNCFNASVVFAAVGNEVGELKIPILQRFSNETSQAGA